MPSINRLTFQVGTKASGREIFVEQWVENARRPRIWYEFNRQKILIKYQRAPTAIQTTHLGKTNYL